jgi:hypothetical protein
MCSLPGGGIQKVGEPCGSTIWDRRVDHGRARKSGLPGSHEDSAWKGWWGPDPPLHTPAFILIHHARPSIEMEGCTTSHPIDASLGEALEMAPDSVSLRVRRRASVAERAFQPPQSRPDIQPAPNGQSVCAIGTALSPLSRMGYEAQRCATRREVRFANCWARPNRLRSSRATACNYTLCAERETAGIRYSYTLYERGANRALAAAKVKCSSDPLSVRLMAPLTGGLS